ncbi:MAG TPA: M20 family metallopeptidase [Anaeromyxobacter sp.]
MSAVRPVELTRELVRIDTVNPTSPERPAAERLGRLLEAGGFQVSRHEFAPGRTSVVARHGPGARPALCLAGHVDTVPLGAAAWSREPFGAEISEGKLYGRGASDMKSGVAAIVCAALDVARADPRVELLVVLVAGEETGCEGSAHLARTEGALGRAGALVVAEPTGNVPLVGHKGALWLEARTRGVTAHGSMPERGVNAIYGAARAISSLEGFRFAVPEDPLLGGATLNVGTMRGGQNVNSVPDAASFTIDVRTVPSLANDVARAALADVLGPEVELRTLVNVSSLRADPDDAWVKEVFDVVEARLGARPSPRSAPYFTDASELTPALGGVPTVILGPGELHLAHQTDEWCLVSRIEEATELYRELATRWLRR